MTSALDHIEKTLADAYRREIEQGENVWRSLPFFAAAIAFQIAALSQVLLRLPRTSSGAWWDAIAAIIVLSLLIFVAVACLAASIVPEQLNYIPDEPALLTYARSLDVDERDAAANHLPPIDAAATLMGTLAQS